MTGSPQWVQDAREGSRRGGAQQRPKTHDSPYFGVPEDQRSEVTRELLTAHPLDGPTLCDAVLASWRSIFQSQLGTGFYIGRDIWPAPQIMGFLLHALVPLELAKGSDRWRADELASEKDLVYIPDVSFSIEVKTSSHPVQIFGNRSFGVESVGKGKKAKDGYYLAINFESWRAAIKGTPRILRIRYGWLDHTDWVAQVAESGQQSALPALIENTQLLTVYES